MPSNISSRAPLPEAVPLRDFSPPASVLSDDFDRLLSEDDLASESDIDLNFSQSSARNLPPVDSGRHAWTFLAVCWLMEACLWGFPLAFGVFQQHYSVHPLFSGSESIPSIGTLATGVSYLGMPFTNVVVLRWPHYQRHMCFAGWLLCVFGLVAASFATKVWQLIMFQGFIYGAGWVVCYTPFLFMLNGWFVERRGLAYGILFGASGVSGLFIPIAVGALLDRFDFEITLRVYAIITIMISGPGFLLLRPRIPPSVPSSAPSSSHSHTIKEDIRLEGHVLNQRAFFTTEMQRIIKSPHFIIFALAIFTQGLSFFLPNIFLLTYANTLSLAPTASNSLLTLTALSQVAGQIVIGYISDIFPPHIPTSLSSLFSGLSAVILWGNAKGMNLLVPFALVWGFWSASYSVLYSSICSFLTQDPDVGMMLYGIFSFERGLANVIEGPVGGWLVGVGDEGVDFEAYALGRYRSVVLFTAGCMFASSLGIVGLAFRKRT